VSLAWYFKDNPQRRYSCSWEGRAGPRPHSAATAYHLASHGHRVLVFSVDPQASLSDIFQRDIFGKGVVEIMPNLYAQEIDADQTYQGLPAGDQAEDPRHVRLDKIPDEIESYISAAAASLPWKKARSSTRWSISWWRGSLDYYIYDLVPLGHALYYLSMPRSTTSGSGDHRPARRDARIRTDGGRISRDKPLDEDLILNELQYIKTRISTSQVS